MTTPHLPPELEYSIFLQAYQNENQDAEQLILVAKRVFDWLVPHIFRIVGLGYKPFPIKFKESAYRKHGHHVRYLWFGSSKLGQHLHLFPSVIDLAYFDYEPTSLPILQQLPLKRLSIHFSPDLIPVFAKLTHLDISYSYREGTIPSDLYLPGLTHMCAHHLYARVHVKAFLDRARCPKLIVAVVWDYGVDEPELDTSQAAASILEDERVVMIQCNPRPDWIRGAQGGVDMWKFAEGVVESRKRDRDAY